MSSDDLITVRVAGKALDEAIANNDNAALANVSRSMISCSRLAYHARKRFLAGKYAAPTRRYSLRRPYIISEGYAEALGVKRRGYKSSADFHSKVKGKKGLMTGGMIKGLRVRNYGALKAVVEFAGKSIGSRIKKNKNSTNQRVNVSNRKKSSQLWKRLRLNPIQPTDDEIRAFGSATTNFLADEIFETIAAIKKTRQYEGNIMLASNLTSDLRRGSRIRIEGVL